jgi:hypothetical protein
MLAQLLAVLLVLAAYASPAAAESTDCTTPVVIIPDGRLTQGVFPQGTKYWYAIYAQDRHSYSVEFEPPNDNFSNTSRPVFSAISVYGSTDYLQACSGTSTVAVTPTSGYSPVVAKGGNGAGRRISFVAKGAGLHLIAVSNVMGSGGYTFRAVDTTLVNVRWNTNNGNETQWLVFNVSDMTVSGILTVFDTSGVVVATSQIVLPPNGRATRYSGYTDLNIPRNQAGGAIFNHNGPPNAILADAFLVYPPGAPPIAVKFEALPSR